MVGRIGRQNAALLALAAPGVVLTCGLFASLALAAVGRSPIWPDHRANLSEAIVAEDDAEVLRVLTAGASLNAAYQVRPGLVSEAAVWATPLQAAVYARRPDIIEDLISRGAAVDAAGWAQLRCEADEAAAAVLERHRPAVAVASCP